MSGDQATAMPRHAEPASSPLGDGVRPGVARGIAQRSGELAIEARGLTKVYHVYDRPQDRLKQMLWPGRRRFYREFFAVRCVDLTVWRGETVGVVGRNGSGKSTLLKMICGTLARTSGELHVRGHIAPMLALGAGFNPEFTGRENVLVNAAILGLSDAQIRARIDSIEGFADIGSFFDQPVRAYSSGMYARLAFAVAIHADPDILVIDEILAVGDEAFNRKCFSRVEEIKRAGSTILFVSHSPNLVVELCDRAVLMEGGERLLVADPKTVISRYHRLLYASQAELSATRKEIRTLDRGETGGAAAGSAGGTTKRGSPEADGNLGRFDPGLRSESRVEYEARGAVIKSPRILDDEGREVNVLRPGRVYTYAYDVEFLEPAFGVRFGMMIKLVSGFELGGQASHPPRKGIEFIAAGSTARVHLEFCALLAPGVYFLNAGVLGLRDGAQTYLHRILDAAIFRIEPEQPGRTTGSVDLTTVSAPRVEIEPGEGASRESEKRPHLPTATGADE